MKSLIGNFTSAIRFENQTVKCINRMNSDLMNVQLLCKSLLAKCKISKLKMSSDNSSYEDTQENVEDYARGCSTRWHTTAALVSISHFG